MGRAKMTSKPPPGVYRDEPDRDDAASTSSAVSLRDHVEMEDEDLPPYTDNPDVEIGNPGEASELVESGADTWTHNDHKGSTFTQLSHTRTTDPVALLRYIIREAAHPPRPYIRIVGHHTETRCTANNKNEKTKVIDFDINIDITETIVQACGVRFEVNLAPVRSSIHGRVRVIENGEKGYRGGRTKSTASRFKADVEATQVAPSLEEWCHLFCASNSKLKSFTLRRTVVDLNEEALTQRLVHFVRSTNYMGHINITYPLLERSVTVMSPHPFNRLRQNNYVWWICVTLQLWVITWPVLWLMTLRWDVVKVEWPFRGSLAPPHMWGEPTTTAEGNWATAWKTTIMRAAEMKRTGWIQMDDEAMAATHQQRDNERAPGGLVEAAVGLVRGVSEVLRDAERSRGWGRDS